MKTFRTRIYPTPEQEAYFKKAFGVRRFVWNWAVDMFFKEYNASGKQLEEFVLSNGFTKSFSGTKGYEWLGQVSNMVRQETFKDFTRSRKMWSEKTKAWKRKANTTEKDAKEIDKFKPKLRLKKSNKQSFRMNYRLKDHPAVRVESNRFIRFATAGLGKTAIFLKTSEPVSFLKGVLIKTSTITKLEDGKYYLTLTYEKTNHVKRNKTGKTIGIDMGIKNFATCHDGTKSWTIDVPFDKILKLEAKVDKLRAERDKKSYQSKNWYRASEKLGRLQIHLNNVKEEMRRDIINQITDDYDVIKIDLFTFQTFNSRGANKSLHRLGIFKFVEFLESKCLEKGVELIKLNEEGSKPVATTQTCSKCGYVHQGLTKLPLNTRVFSCRNCSITMDRDINAAINLYQYK